ncbi:PaaI family thioesterase [Pseudonocardia acaciae]|uniref:PaaI family thioesterase n=1 Tax=Pseudonocardia acaciae TaxID=551276 RepID=UPI00048E4C74|nr:PaaI family thioesterase [Pseudonocardia acaciae]
MNPPELTTTTLQGWLDGSPFIAFLGITCEKLDRDRQRVTLRMPMRPQLRRDEGSGWFHGGPIASLIDIAGDFAVALATGGGVPTVNFRVDYLRPSTGDALVATATVRRAGRTVAVADVDVHDEQGRLTAVGRGTYSTTPG